MRLLGLATESELAVLRSLALRAAEALRQLLMRADLALYDLKFEFGRCAGEIVLAMLCVIVGAAVQGGVGRVVGAIAGGLVMGVLNNGMSLMGISTDVQQFIKGLVLLLAVAFDVWNKNRTRG